MLSEMFNDSRVGEDFTVESRLTSLEMLQAGDCTFSCSCSFLCTVKHFDMIVISVIICLRSKRRVGT